MSRVWSGGPARPWAMMWCLVIAVRVTLVPPVHVLYPVEQLSRNSARPVTAET